MEEAQDLGVQRQKKLGYWEARRHMMYYKSLFQFVCVAGEEAESIIDVGSASTQYMSWFKWIPSRTLLDFKINNKPEGFEVVETDFFEFAPQKKYDVVLCCQVLEHVEDPEQFCTKLKEISKRLIITVPYKWLGNAPGHIHDPVDEAKLYSWMKIRPNSQQIVPEPFRESRLIAYYDLEAGPSARFEKDRIFAAIANLAEHAP
ncbi:MAG: class I SAM-dependent methyltransferase [Marinosulfonomonas sp.]|nr:class I SAM-dependent methyltransferase [Marinosulfonomonas sp.]